MLVTEVRIATDLEVLENHPRSITAVASGIADAMGVAGRDFGFDHSLLSRAQSLTEIELAVINPSGQVNANRFFGVVRDLADRDSPLFVVLSRDLQAEGTNFIFGFGIKEEGLCVQSLFRYA